MNEAIVRNINKNQNALLSLTIWPHRSCSKKMFQTVIILTTIGLTIPSLLIFKFEFLLATLPFSFITIALLIFFSKINFTDAQLKETLKIFPTNILLQRSEPRGELKIWTANPFWTQVRIYNNGPVQSYLTLKGNGKEVEIGSFLTPQEREDLKQLIEATLFNLKKSNFSR